MRPLAAPVEEILESIADAFFAVNRSWQIIYVNGEAERVLLKTAEELLGQTLWEELPQLVDSIFYRECHRAISEGKTVKFEEFYPQLNTWFEIRAYPWPEGLSIYFNDISDRKDAELKLQLYQEIFLRSNDAIAILDPQGYYLEQNAAGLVMLGYTPKELIGKTPSIHMGEGTFASMMQNLMQTGQYRGEVTCQRAWETGTVEVDLSAFSVVNEIGEIVCCVMVKRDITKRKRAEEQLKLYREIFLKANDAIVILDADGFFLEQNLAHQTLLGYTNADLETQSLELLLEDLQAEWGQAESFRGVIANRTKGGQKIDIDISAFSVLNEGGDVICRVGVKRDITERKRGEEEQQKFVSLIENSSDFISMAALDGRILFINEAGRFLVGLESLSEALSTQVIDFIPPEFKSEFSQVILPTVIHQGRWQGESQLQHYRSKRPIDVWMNIFLVKDSQTGQPLCLATVQRDISDRKQAERLLCESAQMLKERAERERLVSAIAQRVRQSLHLTQILSTAVQEVRTLLATDRTVIYRFESDGTGAVVVESVGDAWQPLLGRDIQDNCFADSYIPLYRAGRIRAIEDIYTAGLDRCHICLLEQLQVKANLVVPIVIGDENQECAIESTPLNSAHESSGRSGDLSGRGPAPQNRLWGLLIAHQCSSTRSWTVSEIELLGQLSVQLAIAIQQSTLFEQAQRSREAALEASRLKSMFLATMSHEIRTPMNGVLGMTDLLLRTHLTPEQQDFVQMLKVSSQNLLEIINGILDFSKLEAGEMRLENLEFDLSVCLDEVLDLLASPAQEKELELAALIDSDVPFHLTGDVARLRQILMNLVGNAIKFTETGEVVIHVSRIQEGERCKNYQASSKNVPQSSLSDIRVSRTICTQRNCCAILFQVTDSGIGMAPEDQKHLFRPFNQGDVSTTRKYGGTGLGLAVCKQLVDLMGGEIGVESHVGQGSTFWFTLPLQQQVTKPTEAKLNVIQTSLEGLKMLVVSEKMTVRKVVQRLATLWGMTVDEVERGWMAISVLQKGIAQNSPYDIVLIDMQLPEMTMKNLERLIRSNSGTQQTKWVLLASMSQHEEAKNLLGVGFMGYLTKPVKASRLFDCLISAVNNQRTLGSDSLETQSENRFSSVTATASHSLKILLVEDTPINQKIGFNQLKVLGYHPTIVNNGQEALTVVEVQDYDIILMDCQMPILDGYEATTELRRRENDRRLQQRGQNCHRTVVIGMTANALKGDREKCLAAGMDDYISKPISLEELQRVIESWSGSLKRNVELLLTEEADQEGAKSTQLVDLANPTSFCPVDLDYLKQVSGGNEQFERDLLETFVKDAQTYITEIKQAIASGNAPAVARRAHQLKGASATVAIRLMPAMAGKLESQAEAKNLGSAGEAIAEIERVWATVKSFVEHRS